MDAIERIEVAVRARIVTDHTAGYGPFGYVDSNTLPNIEVERHCRLLKQLRSEVRRSKENFVRHFCKIYGSNHHDLPLWMASELMTFGATFTLFRGVNDDIKKDIARDYGIPDRVLESWLRALNAVRNICAHHGRLWNRELGYKPMIPRASKQPQWHNPIRIENNRVFAIVMILKHMMNRIAPQSHWPQRFEQLLEHYPDIPRHPMGFKDRWQQCPIWTG
jgi:abortive infection bacteriophage resistance protein